MIDICDELRQNAVDFAYEANSQRAFADARDGLKPGQRACIWEMYEKGYTSTKHGEIISYAYAKEIELDK